MQDGNGLRGIYDSPSPFIKLVVHNGVLEQAIMSDIQSIDDVDDFVRESEDEIIEFLHIDQVLSE